MILRLVICAVCLVSFAAGAHAARPDRRKHSQVVERTVAADPRVVISACVSSGDLTIRSWDRNEVHVRVTDGLPIDLTRADAANPKPAAEIKLTARGGHSSCLPMGDIVFDVPRGSTLKLETNNGDINITDVARVSVNSQAGSINLIKIREGVDASTIGGEISVRNSSGAFKLHSVGGTVDARDLTAAQPTDTVDADSIGGDIKLERIQHQRVRVNSVSGQVEFGGPLASGARYSFQSISGQLRMVLPANSSFRLAGSLGTGGHLINDFVKDGVANSHNKRTMTRRLDAIVGTGDAAINISFFSGSVEIRKQ